MRFPVFVWRILAIGGVLSASAFADDKTATPKPGGPPPLLLHEIWVPANALDPILARYPRAVSLGRDQLLTLLHDAHEADPAIVDPSTLPPERAVLRQARFDGRLVSGAQMQVSGELEVEVFSDQWAQVPLGLPGVALGTAEIDDGRPANLRRLPGKGDRPTALLIQGRGLHRLRLGFVLPVATGPESSAMLPSVAGVGEFTLHLPAGTRADGAGGCIVEPDGGGVLVRAALGAVSKDTLRWRTPPPPSEVSSAVLQDGRVDAVVGEAAVTIRQEITLRAALGTLPGETRLALPPGARAVRVEGTTARWDLGTDGLRVALDPAASDAAFQVLYDLPLTLDPGGVPTKTAVPLLEAVGARRVTGRIAVRQGPGVQVRRVEPGAIATPAVGNGAPDIVADFSLADLPAAGNPPPATALTLEARRTRTRFSVDADAQASFPPGMVFIMRNLTFHVEEGTLFGARIPLPKGEVLTVLNSNLGADWRQEGDDVILTWTAGVPEKSAAWVQLETQTDFTPPTTGTPTPFHFRAVPVPGAEQVTGYVAVYSTPALRVVTTGGDEHLERRDARTTPVTGDVAWFYRDGFDLALRVERRATETEARFTGYALPLAGAVEIHGQIDYHFLHAGVDTVKIRVPGDAADAFFFTGEHVAERRRDGDVWTIRFQGEQTGDYALGVQATIPTPADKDDAERFHFRLPTVAPLDTARWSGVWAVEANTDTEISFHAVGASEVDTLRAPALAGYQPRRRVIGVFEFLGNGAAETAIDLDGVRHPAANVAVAVVDSLSLETFASTSGVARHRATLRARTASDGFFNVRLPEGAAVWSLTRDGALIKPVGGAAGDLRVELPGGRDPSAASTVVVIYETPGPPWASSGQRTLAAPRFDPGVPVIESRWTLHVPDGFDYRIADGALTPTASPANVGDLLLPQIGGALGHAAQWAYYYPRYLRAVEARTNGIADPASLTRDLPNWMVAELSRKFSVSSMTTELDTGPVLGEPVQELILPKDQTTPALPGSPLPEAKFIDKVQQVKDLLLQAQGYYDSGRYDLAFKRYEQILTLDPYNNAARKGEERVDLQKARHGDPYSYDETRGRLLGEVSQDWGMPVRRQGLEVDPRRGGTRQRDDVGNAAITRKLASIIIPNIEFHSTTISDAIEYLRQESRRLDTDPDADARGVNIFLKLPGSGAAAPVAAADAIPGLPTGAGNAGASAATANTRITLTLGRIPLLEALKYVASQAGLKVKVEPYAVSIVPVSEQTDVMVTADFHVPPNFISNSTSGGGIGTSALNQGAVSAQGGGGGGTTDASGTGGVTISRQDAKTFLEASGVTFPPGASATYLPGTSKLVVRNTQENVDLMEALIQANPPDSIPQPVDQVTLNGHPFTNEQLKDAKADSDIFGKDKLATAEFSVSPDFLAGRDVTVSGSVTIQRQDAKSFLEAQGMSFPPGASATYLPSTGKIVLRNTPDAIKRIAGSLAHDRRSDIGGIGANAIDTLLYGGAGKPKASVPNGVAGVATNPPFQFLGERESAARVAGLLPIQLDLPDNGITYAFAGGGEPGTLAFHYTDWRSAARWRWIWLTLGAAAFLLGAAGWAHPWRRTLWAMLALTFWPLAAAPGALTLCNALLAGWLWAVLGWAVTRWMLRRQRVAAMLAALCAAALLPTNAHAAPKATPTPTPTPPPETVIVPYDATKPTSAQQPTQYYLPYERFLELWDAAKRHRRPAAPELPPGGERYTLNTARYDARLVGDILEIDAILDFQTFGEGWVDVPLKLDGEMVLDGAPVSLSDGGILWVGTPGSHHLAATLRLPAGALAAGSDLSWTVLPTAATLVTFLLPRTDLRAEVHSNAPGGGGVIEEVVPEGRHYLAAAGGATTVRLDFHDVPPPTQAAGQPALARIVSRLNVGGRQETVHSEISFPFPGRAQDHFTVYLDPGLTLTSLNAPGVREWHLSTGGNRQTLDLALDLPARDIYTLSLEADRPPASAAADRRTFPTVSAQAGRIEQITALLADGALAISLPDGPPRGARRTEWKARPDDGGRVFDAFESDGSPVLVYRVDARSEKRTAHIDYLYQPGRGKIEWAASVRLSPEAGGAPIQTADLQLPAGTTVQAVAGGAVRQWWRDGDRLSLRFGGTGEVSFIVYLVQSLGSTPEKIVLHPLSAPGFAEMEGESVVAADRSLRVGLTLPTGARSRDLSEIDPGKAAGEFQVKAPLERQRAFRYRNGFELAATLELLPALWQTQTVTQATVREGTIALEIRVNVQAQQGALDALEFSLPAGLPEASVSGPDVRETIPLPIPAGQDRQTYRVLWQNPVYGGSEAAFTVSLELPLGAGSKAALPELRLPGARAASAFLLVENTSSGEMTLDPHGLDPAIEKDLPFLPAQIVAGTRFFRVAPGVPWSLGVAVADLQKTAGRAALVAYAELTTTLRSDGEEWHRAIYRLQNRRLQFLPVELPRGVDFIGARVAGESVRVDAGQDHTLLVPLLETRPGELSYDVELIYRRPAPRTTGDRPRRTWGRWQLDDPKLPGIPVEKTLWDVFLPTDTQLVSCGGNVDPVVAAVNETEKLESALSDLRSLSATYQSASATRQEQALALSNFNSLAADVKSKAQPGDNRRRVPAENTLSALFKQPDATSQNAVVGQKQRLIQSELDSLSMANATARQAPRATDKIFHGGGTSGVGRSVDASGGFEGHVDYGSPVNPLSSSFSASGQLQGNWRDNRTLDQNRTRAFDVHVQAASGAATEAKRQLALNDSVTVDLPSSSLLARPEEVKKELSSDADVLNRSRLSTARATVDLAGVKTASPPAPETRLRRPTSQEPPAIPGLASAPGTPDIGAGGRTETLRSMGSISLAVDFPQTGQVYHFKKLKADAHLTLWSVRPAAFARLSWLLVLAALFALGGAARRRTRQRSRLTPL